MDNKKEPEIIGLFSVFKLLHLHLKENENFKPKFVSVGHRRPYRLGSGTANPHPVLWYIHPPQRYNVSFYYLPTSDLLKGFLLLHCSDPYCVFKVRWQLSNTPTHFRVFELQFYQKNLLEIAKLRILWLKLLLVFGLNKTGKLLSDKANINSFFGFFLLWK